MKNNDLITLEKSNLASPLIEEEVISKLESIHAYLIGQGVKAEKYDVAISGCGSCSGWSSGKGICEGSCDN